MKFSVALARIWTRPSGGCPVTSAAIRRAFENEAARTVLRYG